jgi:hypothetical protein
MNELHFKMYGATVYEISRLVQLGGNMYPVLSAEARGKTTHAPAPNWRGICGTQY